MEKLYEVKFTHRGQEYWCKVEADSKADAIAQAQEIAPGEDYAARLICVDGVAVYGLWGGAEE